MMHKVRRVSDLPLSVKHFKGKVKAARLAAGFNARCLYLQKYAPI